jgi:hypothetical protein
MILYFVLKHRKIFTEYLHFAFGADEHCAQEIIDWLDDEGSRELQEALKEIGINP